MSEWQTMDSAPQDGSEFQAWITAVSPQGNPKCWWEPKARVNPDSGSVELWGRTDYDQDGWETYSHLTATHWMPPPDPPVENPGIPIHPTALAEKGIPGLATREVEE
jgi:hypothetical protein